MQDAGGKTHREYWIPSANLDAFNAAFVGEIKITAEFKKRRRQAAGVLA